ncbi:MAG: hypothetical protein U0169_23060 [Polyangiaceae bacterium]
MSRAVPGPGAASRRRYVAASADDPSRGFDARGDSGWTLVRDAEVTDGEADHGYFYVGGLQAAQSPDAIDPVWDTGDVLWGRSENLRWLASKLGP